MDASSLDCTANLNRLEIRQIIINAEDLHLSVIMANCGVGSECLHATT